MQGSGFATHIQGRQRHVFEMKQYIGGMMPGANLKSAVKLGRAPVKHVISVIAALFCSLSACAVPTIDPPLATGAVPPIATTDPTVKSARLASAVQGQVKVALLLPLSATGQTALIAKSLKQAAELALFDASTTAFQLIVKDDKGTPEGATQAAEEAVTEGAELIIGPLFSGSVKAVSVVARRKNLPVIAFSNDSQAAGPGVYLLSFQIEQDVQRIVSYTATTGRRRFAALIPDDDYGRQTEQAFRVAVASANGTVAVIERYPAQANAMLEPTRRLVEAIRQTDAQGQPVDALFLPGGPEVLASLGPVMTYASLDTSRIKLIGTGGWDHPNIGRDAALVGGWFPAPEPRGWQDFSERFSRTFGSTPPRIATLAHDAVMVATQLAANPAGTRYSASTLTRSAGFIGADGVVRLKANGTAERDLAVLEVQKIGVTVVAPATTSGAVSNGSSALGPVN